MNKEVKDSEIRAIYLEDLARACEQINRAEGSSAMHPNLDPADRKAYIREGERFIRTFRGQAARLRMKEPPATDWVQGERFRIRRNRFESCLGKTRQRQVERGDLKAITTAEFKAILLDHSRPDPEDHQDWLDLAAEEEIAVHVIDVHYLTAGPNGA